MQNLKDMKSSVCLSVLVAFKITKVDIPCIITCDSSPYCSNFIILSHVFECTTLRKKIIMITRNIDSKSSLTFIS